MILLNGGVTEDQTLFLNSNFHHGNIKTSNSSSPSIVADSGDLWG